MRLLLHFSPCILSLCLLKSDAFLTPQRRSAVRVGRFDTLRDHHRHSSELYNFFRRGNDSEDKESSSDRKDGDDGDSDVPFFARFGFGKKSSNEGDGPSDTFTEDAKVATSTATIVEEKVPAPAVVQTPKPAPLPESPAERAAALRAQAEKIRLEAELDEAELTLTKISKLEKEIAQAQKAGSGDTDSSKKGATDIAPLQREMEALQAKMRGEAPPPPVPAPTPEAVASSSSSIATASAVDTSGEPRYTSANPMKIVDFDEEAFETASEFIAGAPDFMTEALAEQVGLDTGNLNNTELAIRVDKLKRFDYSFSDKEKPSFTRKQIDERIEELNDFAIALVDSRLVEAAGGNKTELALLALEYDYFVAVEPMDISLDQLVQLTDGDAGFKQLAQAMNVSAVDATVEVLYPKCTRKEDGEPTLAQAERLIQEILPKTLFSSSSRPEKVTGGYIIRGVLQGESTGDEVIKSIDQQLERTNLADKLSVLLTKDFATFSSADFDREDWTPDQMSDVLYIGGPDLVREPQRTALSITSALGLATSWYLSLYPFLLNPDLSKRVDDQLALADASMAADLSWLTDLSLPLFTTFVAIQASHELAHRAVAAFYNVKLSVPTWVPSIITGITSSVTTFRTLPPNKQAMFDISIAGPLVGMLASMTAIALGSQLSASMDPASFPALPLEILRQSTLGGGLIETSLSGVLSVPEGALGTSAIQEMMIPLHPMAVAGYISLVLNALALLPIGTTDGGRIAMSVFGRVSKPAIGSLFMVALFTVGILGSDLFLFYFAFCLAFQSGNEVPARNEVDLPDFSRIIVATIAYVLAALTLVPFQ